MPKCFIKYNDGFNICNAQPSDGKVPAGIYKYEAGFSGYRLEEMKFNHDEIIDIPSKEFKLAIKNLDNFLEETTKAKYTKEGFIYKLNICFHGIPGTGKTVLVSRIAQEVVKKGGIVVFDPEPSELSKLYEALDTMQPETLCMVVFEEFDDTIRHNEKTLLSLLDGEVQKSNMIYVATTNHLDKIPARILRPGRFPVVMEILSPTEEERLYFLNKKLDNDQEAALWAENTEGFTIDDLKVLVSSVKLLNNNYLEVITNIRNFKKTLLENKQ